MLFFSPSLSTITFSLIAMDLLSKTLMQCHVSHLLQHTENDIWAWLCSQTECCVPLPLVFFSLFHLLYILLGDNLLFTATPSGWLLIRYSNSSSSSCVNLVFLKQSKADPNFLTSTSFLPDVIHPLRIDFLNAGLPHLDLIDEPGGLGKLPVILAQACRTYHQPRQRTWTYSWWGTG